MSRSNTTPVAIRDPAIRYGSAPSAFRWPLGMDVQAAARADPENAKAELDRRLDLALEETFPASDPVSVMVCRGPS